MTAPSQYQKLVSVHTKKIQRLAEATPVPAQKKLETFATVDAWADAITALLLGGHEEAWRLGRLHAGDDTASSYDALFARGIVDNEQRFFEAFLADIRSGRYTTQDGEPNVRAISQRLNLYVQKYRATACEAWVETNDELEEYEWVLGLEDHCNSCPQLAALSPYTKSELFSFPGSGDTECLTNCNCVLKKLSDGQSSFPRQ